MKKFSVILLLLLIITNFTDAQEAKQAITANPIGLVFGIFNAQYEFALTGVNSLALRGNYVGYKIGDYSNSAFGIGCSYRWYMGESKPITGWWLQPSVDILFWTAKWTTLEISGTYPFFYKEVDKEETVTFIGIGGDGGYKWNWDGFCLELSGGIRYYIGEIAGLSFGGVAPSLGVGVGYAW